MEPLSESTDSNTEVGILSRIDHLLFQPHPALTSPRVRQQSRFLSILVFVAIPIFLYAQATSDIEEFPLYLLVLLAYLLAYVISRTKHYNLAAGIGVAASSVISIVQLYYSTDYVPHDLPRVL
jgi:hypothetical protein